jgi:hypothetical protein
MKSRRIARSESAKSVTRGRTSLVRTSSKMTHKVEKETIHLTVNGEPYELEIGSRPHEVDVGAHRDKDRMRSRSLRSMHCPHGWEAGALLHDIDH